MVLGCRFRAGLSPSDLKVTWHWISSASTREVYRLADGAEQTATQDPVYRGRAALLREELEDGWARLKVSTRTASRPTEVGPDIPTNAFPSLQISGLGIGDSGTYQCLVQTGNEADYTEMQLSVTGELPASGGRLVCGQASAKTKVKVPKAAAQFWFLEVWLFFPLSN